MRAQTHAVFGFGLTGNGSVRRTLVWLEKGGGRREEGT